MKLFDTCEKIICGESCKITRVPGGWIYNITVYSSVFVPFNNAFQDNPDNQTYLIEGLDYKGMSGGSFADTSINEK